MSTQPTTLNPAKAVQYVCRLLRSYGVGPKQLSPELVRQAKLLDAPTVSDCLGLTNPPHAITHTATAHTPTCCSCRPPSPF
jgi:hypothetical protein